MNPQVDFYFAKSKWQAELQTLRRQLLASGLTEVLKWGVPCYTQHGRNIALLHGFKDYCALLFVKGALLKDPQGLLIQQTENVQGARQLRFTTLAEVSRAEPFLPAYLHEAMAIEQAGLKVPLKPVATFPVPAEFQAALTQSADLNSAFHTLTPGRQRAYLLHFAAPKQTQTRTARVEKASPKILAGQGLND